MKDEINFNILTYNQKVNCIKSLLFSSDINYSLDLILRQEKKDLELTSIILDAINDKNVIERIKEHLYFNDEKYVKAYVYSKIISILTFYNNTSALNNFFKSLSESSLKEIASYEYNNKTEISTKSEIFNKYCLKYKDEVLLNQNENSEENLQLTMEIKAYNNLIKRKKRPNKLVIVLVVLIMIFISVFGVFEYTKYSNILKKYDGKILPGIYLNNTSLSNIETKNLCDIILNETEKIENGKIVLNNINGDYIFSYKEMGIKINNENIEKEIIEYNSNLNFFRKIKLLNSKKREKIFSINGYFSDEALEKFIVIVKNKVNVSSKDASIVMDSNYDVYFDKGTKGFALDEAKLREDLKDSIINIEKEIKINLKGNVIENKVLNENLSSINKKISSYTTYFENSGNRGHNVSLASSKLNGTIINPGEEFSYLKSVGPYNGNNGYLPAPVYIGGVLSYGNGGGVCQLASTTYMAQLYAGLETVYRTNHSHAPAYVPKGLDATVSGTWPDYKFKNQYNYPIYISSYVKGNYVTVDIWSNENALEGKTFEPYSVKKNSGYASYLKVYLDGKKIEEKYLGMSYYK